MTDSHFGTTDASGYAPDTVSTARDLLLLGQEALKNPVNSTDRFTTNRQYPRCRQHSKRQLATR